MTQYQTRKSLNVPYSDSIFKEFYMEELEKNPLYRHLLTAMKAESKWPQEAWREALGDLHDYESVCFQKAFDRMQEICGTESDSAVKLNEFVFYRSMF